MIEKKGSRWILYNKSGTRKLGEYKTKKEALRQEIAIEMSKKKKRGSKYG